MVNFLEETKEAIKDSGHTVEDIHFIGSTDGEYSITWKNFEAIANVEYDDGFGAAEVATDLIILFTDTTYMTRGEYDGSEWWSFRPAKPLFSQGKPIARLIGGGYGEMWPKVSELNKEKDAETINT